MKTASLAFTLIELLVVVTIIVVLLALLAPALDKAIDAATTARCAAQQHALCSVTISYAMDNRRGYMHGLRDYRSADTDPVTGSKIPSGGAVDDYDEHIPYLGTYYIRKVIEYSGNSQARDTWNNAGYVAGGLPPILVDPSFPRSFGIRDAYGSWIGYNYLAGHPYTDQANGPRENIPDWKSPMSLTRAGTGEMWACHNTWETGGRLANIAHTRPGGPAAGGEYFNWTNGGKRPEDFQSAGGNVGRTDGSSTWKDLEDMHEYASGANKAGAGYWTWPAMW